MSFWSVPLSFDLSTPSFSATATYIARRIAAGPLIVIEVDTCPKSMSAKRSTMSSRVSIATPARPTSPIDHSSSESRPIRVGISKAVESPVPPARKRSLNRTLVSSAVPKPANIRIVHNRSLYMPECIPRV